MQRKRVIPAKFSGYSPAADQREDAAAAAGAKQNEPTEDENGRVTARFATLGVLDRDSDLIMPGSIGRQDVRRAVWDHARHRPVIRGRSTRETRDGALSEGEFSLGPPTGLDAHRIAKRTGNLQGWRHGFDIQELRRREPEEWQSAARWGGRVREVLTPAVFGVSLGLLGARAATRDKNVTTNATEDAVVHVPALSRLHSGEPPSEAGFWSLGALRRTPVDEVATILDCAGNREPRALAPSADTPAAPTNSAALIEGISALSLQAAARRPEAPGATRATRAPCTQAATSGTARPLGGHRHA